MNSCVFTSVSRNVCWEYTNSPDGWLYFEPANILPLTLVIQQFNKHFFLFFLFGLVVPFGSVLFLTRCCLVCLPGGQHGRSRPTTPAGPADHRLPNTPTPKPPSPTATAVASAVFWQILLSVAAHGPDGHDADAVRHAVRTERRSSGSPQGGRGRQGDARRPRPSLLPAPRHPPSQRNRTADRQHSKYLSQVNTIVCTIQVITAWTDRYTYLTDQQKLSLAFFNKFDCSLAGFINLPRYPHEGAGLPFVSRPLPRDL